MQGAGDGRELSITFQTSGKAVRLSAPEKWRKAVAGEDLKPDSWVEIHRQGGSPQTVQANDVPELHALFVELGLAPATPAAPVLDAAVSAPEPAPDGADSAPAIATAPSAEAGSHGFGALGQPPPPPHGRRLAGEGRRIGGGIVAFIIGLVVLTNIIRSCSHDAHRSEISASPAAQMTIAVDSSTPSSAITPVSSAADPAAQARGDAGTAAPAASAPATDTEAAASPSFDCGRVTSDNLKLVCATPDLATADRTLAAAYKAALAAAADPAEVRDSERDWIAARNAAPADVDQLRALYADRIRVLRDAAKAPEPF